MDVSQTANASALRPVLIVEDNVALREHFYDVLAHRGFSVIAVPSVERAFATLKHERPGLILADIHSAMASDMTVWDFTDRLRALDGHLPIVLLGDIPHDAPAGAIGTIQARLPATVSDESLLQEVDRWFNAAEPARRQRWPGTILVVDDEPKLRALLQEFLNQHGFTVTTAASGEEALDVFQRSSPSVVLLDIKMPGMDGLTALREIRALRPSATVIMITGLEGEQAMAEAQALGANGYIVKPFNLEYLETVLLNNILLGHTP